MKTLLAISTDIALRLVAENRGLKVITTSSSSITIEWFDTAEIDSYCDVITAIFKVNTKCQYLATTVIISIKE